MKLPAIPTGLAGKIVKYHPLSEPIRLQDLEDSARSQVWKKKLHNKPLDILPHDISILISVDYYKVRPEVTDKAFEVVPLYNLV